jgi:hypothetical protein
MGFIEAVIEHAVNLGDMKLSPQASGLPLASGLVLHNEAQGFLYDPISAQAVGNSPEQAMPQNTSSSPLLAQAEASKTNYPWHRVCTSASLC